MNNELYHFKYTKRVKTASGKWRYWYEDEEKNEQPRPVKKTTYAQNMAAQKKQATEKANKDDPLIKQKKALRYVEAAKTYLDSRLQVKVADIVKGTARVATWEEAKQFVDTSYATGDKRLFISKRYKER